MNQDENSIVDNKKMQILNEMSKINKDVTNSVDMRLLDDKYINTLGIEKINLISCYTTTQEQILSLNDKEYEVFISCMNNYLLRNKTNNWTTICSRLLDNISCQVYQELISNIKLEDVNLDKLSKILQNKNTFELKNKSDIDNYEEIKRKKCDEIIRNSKDIDDVKNAVFQKLFGQDLEYSERISKKYGADIKNVNDSDEKDYVICINRLMKIEDIDVLKEIYEKSNEIGLVDHIFMEETLKKRYFEKYNYTLYHSKEEDRIKNNQIDEENVLEDELKGKNVYYAGTDFSMIISTIRGCLKADDRVINYKENWNRPEIEVLHFCASYIRNDMIGTIDRDNSVTYGFTNMNNDSLILSGNVDISSDTQPGTPISYSFLDLDMYFTPNSLINKTGRYNELDIARWQEGKKVEPSYIVAFRKKGKIDNLKEIVRSYNDWEGKIPIVVVDIDKCLESELKKVNNMLVEYYEKHDIYIAKEILQKVNNNSITASLNDDVFAKSLTKQIHDIKCEIGKKENIVTESDYEKSYNDISIEERQQYIKDIMDKTRYVFSKDEVENIERE